MTQNLYATLDALKARLGLTDTADDAILSALLYAVSREIETWTGRRFFSVVQTRYFTARGGSHIPPRLGIYPWGVTRLLVDDLLSITALATDISGDRTYPTIWATTDYDLEPFNASLQPMPGPYWRIEATPNGRYGFPLYLSRGVKVFGTWGYYDVLTTSAATLAEVLDLTETGVDVSDGTVFQVGQVIEIDSERMEISGIATNTLTVERGVNGTTAATHAISAAIKVATFPIVGEACLLQAQRQYAAKNMPQGMSGGEALGIPLRQQFAAGLHPFVKDILAPFRVPRAG